MTTPAPLPEPFEIPETLLHQWLSLPMNQRVDAPLTRKVVEHLFFAIDKMARSQEHIHTCLIYLSNQQVDEANGALVESQRAVIESQNRLRQYLMEIIVDATRG